MAASINTCIIDGIALAPTVEDNELVWFLAAHDAIRTSCPNPAPLRPARLSKAAEAAPVKRQEKAVKNKRNFNGANKARVQPNRGHCV